ncbi:hypothetical protein TWF730_007054 [Orbilia blumenaviensis]|uniref:Peptidase A1 domain-containing protein n=1 Tax=Orbilia blumenaviensis TaxID=1796055 RepID=A0AAV9VGF9_9PEZI
MSLNRRGFSFMLFVVWSASFQAAHSAVNCSAGAIPLQISNVTLGSPNRGRPVLFGIDMNIGGQAFVPFVNVHASDIQIKSTDKSCEGVDPASRPFDCVPVGSADTDENVARKEYMLGGFFDGGISNTYHGPNPWRAGKSNITFTASDDITLGDSPLLTFENHTFRSGYNTFVGADPPNFELFNDDSWTPAYIGLNKDSTLLNDLYDNGRIPSRSWGYFSGWREDSPRTQSQSGLAVFGGYDAAKADGPFVNFPITDPTNTTDRCKLKVDITKMWISFGNEERTEEVSTFIFKEKRNGFEVCIDPSYTAIQLPTIVRRRLMQQIKDILELKEILGTIPQGVGIGVPSEYTTLFTDMSLKFNFGGLNITIPSGHLLHAPRNYTSEGLMDIESLSTFRVLDIVDGGPFIIQDSFPHETAVDDPDLFRVITNEPPILFGYPFLAAAYLFVNHDNDTFSIASIASDPSKIDIVPVLAQTCPGAIIGPPNPKTSETPDPTEHGPTGTREAQSPRKLKPAYIAGIVVGGALWLAAMIVIFMLWRRRLHKQKTVPSPPPFEQLEVDGNEMPVVRYEADGRQISRIFEADAHQSFPPSELEGCSPLFEMDGGLCIQKIKEEDTGSETDHNTTVRIVKPSTPDSDSQTTRNR